MARRLACPSTLFCFALFLVLSDAPASARTVPLAIDVGAGLFFPGDGDHREIYGTGAAFSLGVSPRLARGDAYITLEAGLVRSSGMEFSNDPTFEAPDETYWLVPLSVGVRANAVRTDPPSPVRLYLGVAGETVLTWWKREGSDSHSTPTIGLSAELRPEVDLSPSMGLWLRTRVSLLGSVRYRESGIPEINYSGNTLQLGLSYRVE